MEDQHDQEDQQNAEEEQQDEGEEILDDDYLLQLHKYLQEMKKQRK